MRIHSILAVLCAGLVLGPLLSPRPASAATATVTYTIAGPATYGDAVNFPTGGGSVTGGSLTVRLVGVTLTPNVRASWTQGWVTGLNWATAARPSLALVGYVPGFASGTGTAGGNGTFNLTVPPGTPWLVDPPPPAGGRSRFITFYSGGVAGWFNGAAGGLGGASAFGTDAGYPWFISDPAGGLQEVASSISIVPEPSTGLLLGLGLAGLAAFGRRLHGGGRERA